MRPSSTHRYGAFAACAGCTGQRLGRENRVGTDDLQLIDRHSRASPGSLSNRHIPTQGSEAVSVRSDDG